MAKNKSRQRKRKGRGKITTVDPVKVFDLSPFEAMVGSMHLIRADIASKTQLFSPTTIKQSFKIDIKEETIALITENGLTLKDLLPGFLSRIPEMEQKIMDFITDVRTSAFTDHPTIGEREEVIESLTNKGQDLHSEFSDWCMVYSNSIQPIYLNVINHLNTLAKEQPEVDGAAL